MDLGLALADLRKPLAVKLASSSCTNLGQCWFVLHLRQALRIHQQQWTDINPMPSIEPVPAGQ